MMKNILQILTLLNLFLFSCGAYAVFDTQSAAFSINTENKDINNINEVQKISLLLEDLEKNWNRHELNMILQYYSDTFVNGDGLPLESINKLTKELWEAYPDVQTKAQERIIRVYDEYATVDSVDIFEGMSSMVRPEVDSYGVLKAISVGELFLRKFGNSWKITSDKTIFEKVSIGYALGTELVDQNKIRLITPEQVAAGQDYTAKLELDLPPDVKPVAAISQEILTYPQLPTEDKFRLINETKLERLLRANKNSKNELITATVGLTGGSLKPKLVGLVFLSRRVNIVPGTNTEINELGLITTPARSALSMTAGSLDFSEETENLAKEKSADKDEKNKEEINSDN